MTRAAGPVRYEVAEGIATIALDQPETRNALSDAMLDALLAAFERARDDQRVRVVVLTSTHEKVFSAGGDLAGFTAEQPLVHKYRSLDRFPRLLRLILDLRKPTIAKAGGHVLAGALGLVLACDLVVAHEDVRFGTPEIDVGVFPFMIMALIFRNVGRKKATELLLLGERIGAAEAERIGLVNAVVPAVGLDEAVGAWAAKLARSSPLLLGLGKDAISRSMDQPLDDALDFLRGQLALAFSTEDVQEGVRAFFDRREPVWRGR